MVGHNTSCKAYKVCILLWPMGWDDVRTSGPSGHFELAGQEVWWKICFDCVVVEFCADL